MPLVREVSIENYKSIRKLTMELGRVNVLIGANGSGKSNLLEAIAYGSAAARNKLDNEYLAPRGIRVTDPRFMRSAFPGSDASGPVVVSIQVQGATPLRLAIDPERRTLVSPRQAAALSDPDAFIEVVSAELQNMAQKVTGTSPADIQEVPVAADRQGASRHDCSPTASASSA